MTGGTSTTRSESEKERTKMRERQRRAITTKIFHGLRKHGGYHLSPRSDINEVLRELAREAGWVVEPDGTTYRYKGVNRCPTCGAMPSRSTDTTPTNSSTIIVGGGGAGVGGAAGGCSTTTSPHCIGSTLMMISNYRNSDSTATSPSTNLCGEGPGTTEVDAPLAFYTYSGLAGGVHHPGNISVAGPAVVAGGGMKVPVRTQLRQGTYMQEARASNQNTPVGSPTRPIK